MAKKKSKRKTHKSRKQSLKRGGLVVGAPHSKGGVDFVIEDTGKHVEEEGEETNIPREIANDSKQHEFYGSNAEVLDQILRLGGLKLSDKVTTVKSGDIVICVKSTWDKTKRTYKGTVRQILSAINESGGCNHIESGAKVRAEGEREKKMKKGGVTPSYDFFSGINFILTGDHDLFAKSYPKPHQVVLKQNGKEFMKRSSETHFGAWDEGEKWKKLGKDKSYELISK